MSRYRELSSGLVGAVLLMTFAAASGAKEPEATAPERLKVAPGFKVERLYSVPKETEGSWVNLCIDPKGRLIVCDQYGGLFRVTPPAVGQTGAVKIEPIPVAIGEAQGLLWAFDSLYVVVNTGGKYASGLYRVRDTNNDDMLDTVETLRLLDGKAEHGPHAVLLTPDGKGLYIVCGNNTKLTQFDKTRVPPHWGEDHLLPRMPDGRGFMKAVMGPGGAIYKVDPNGKSWELIAVGFRNQFDAALNAAGELFTFDADMEWDVNTPWYRPTRVCHVVSGAEFGWRNGAGKWPAYYPDSTPAAVDIGPGSPTGIVFGHGAKFPAKYQQALFISDWSYGKLYAVHLTPRGASYGGSFEEFISGSPLPLTDVIINPHDGAMYFAIGGRKTTSGLYRVTYAANDLSTEPVDLVALAKSDAASAEARALRHKLEAFHGGPHADAVKTAWQYLDHPDRFIRQAARIAIEHQPLDQWSAQVFAENRPGVAIAALLAYVRVAEPCPFHRQPTDPPLNAERLPQVLAALDRIDWATLTPTQQLDLVRVYHIAFNRLGPPNVDQQRKLIAKFQPAFPSPSRELTTELAQLLVYLQAPIAEPLVKLLETAPTQEEQIDHARSLRMLKAGWTPALRETYFRWFNKATGFRGGASFALFVQGIKKDALEGLTPAELATLKPILEAAPATQVTQAIAPPRPFVKEWKLAELVTATETGLKGRNFDKGKALFAAANCFACHRYDQQGGALGPDLTGVAGRFSPRDLLESIVEPSKVISDQYAAVTITTTDGKSVTGRIVNLAGDNWKINTNMLSPDEQVVIDAKKIDEVVPSTVSMMPAGLLNSLQQEEILDLVAYALSRGDRNHAMFQSAGGQ